MQVVATAGHVDHGKSALVLALTGTDPDRWPEEKARGLTIDLGFAHGEMAGRPVAWVDVPGHVRFIRNMLAGVGAIDAAVLVVAATEGWKAQSEEHLRILDLLGVAGAAVALTKAGLVDPRTLAERRAEVGRAVAGSGFAAAPVVAVDSRSGLGLDTLASALAAGLGRLAPQPDAGRARLWVDRAFSVRGAGTVVTGTLTGGRLGAGDTVQVVGGVGDPAPARVRGVQVHGQPVAAAGPGTRVALNLAGLHPDRAGRGTAVVHPGQWAPTRVADATLEVLAGLGHDVGRRGAYEVHAGSAALPARLRILGPAAIPAGGSGLVRLHLPTTVPLLPGDRYVLREHGRSETVGGGRILDVDPVVPAGRATPDGTVERFIAERGWVDAGDLERRTGVRRPPDAGRWVVDPDRLAAATRRLLARIESAGADGIPLAALGPEERALVPVLEATLVRGGRVVAGGGDGLSEASRRWLAGLDAAPWAPPPPADYGVTGADLRRLREAALVVERDGMWWAAGAVAGAAHVMATLLADHPAGVGVGPAREAWGVSRRYAVPLLELLDASGVTRRRGDVRIPGPRLPSLG